MRSALFMAELWPQRIRTISTENRYSPEQFASVRTVIGEVFTASATSLQLTTDTWDVIRAALAFAVDEFASPGGWHDFVVAGPGDLAAHGARHEDLRALLVRIRVERRSF